MPLNLGNLEGMILCVLWDLEKDGIYTNSVKTVFDVLDNQIENKRAYTTVKTVMDRLVDKKILLRFKQDKKFYYRTAYSMDEIVISSLNNIAQKFLKGDINKLKDILNSQNKEILKVI